MEEYYRGKLDCIARAEELLQRGEEASLPYAALELRMCIEAITYKKISSYVSRLPGRLLSCWQPPQAVSALIDLESDAELEYEVALGLGPNLPPGSLQSIGAHRTFSRKWLKKNYNKLSNLLHIRNTNDPAEKQNYESVDILRKYLEEVLIECKRVADSDVTLTMARTIQFTCFYCKREILCNADRALQTGRVSCLYPDCEAEHSVAKVGDTGFTFSPIGISFECLSCHQQATFLERRLAPGFSFECEGCKKKYRVIDKAWRYESI